MKNGRFGYLVEKIEKAKFMETPFRHIYLENFFSQDDFTEISESNDNRIGLAESDEEMFNLLFSAGYKIIDFPGCTTNKSDYIKWHKRKNINRMTSTSCEGFGMTLRLISPKSEIFVELKDFIEGDYFNKLLTSKFDIKFDDCSVDGGIQKYLDGYEISPHPDIRKKALTFMVNINPHENSENLNHHTKYLRLNKDKKYVREFWEGNPSVDRCWVPWDWCEVVSTQTANNSIVIFSPTNDTMHGIKASYNHLGGQRTQLYGNLWYKNPPVREVLSWERFDILNNEIHAFRNKPKISVKSMVSSLLPTPIRVRIKKLVRGEEETFERVY